MTTGAELIIQQIMSARGIKDVERFLSPDYERDSHDPMLLPDIKPALARLKIAKAKSEQVVIYGDYDIDGLCASALLLDAFKQFGLNAAVFIPDRFTEGYGLNIEALKKLAKDGVSLVVTVDCGSTAVEAIAEAKKQGLDIIVTDHHEPPAKLPAAIAVINPKRPDSKYPFRDLAGNGVAFKLVQAMQTKFDGLADGQEKWLLDLVAFGTVCDVVSLTDENRMLVSMGLKVMARTRRVGLRALSAVTGVPLDQVNSNTFGFIFGPRLNAAGRLEHAKISLELLTSTDKAEALELARKLELMNSQRKSDQAKIERSANQLVADLTDDKVLVLAGKDWSHGIIGIVAARLLEAKQKPVFIMQIIGDTAKGSARSFGDFDASAALEHARDLLITGGGHKAAAGFSLPSVNIEEFRRRLNEFYKLSVTSNQSHFLAPASDVSLSELKVASLELWQALQTLQPFGHGHVEPLLEIKPVTLVEARRVGNERAHLKVTVVDEFNHTIDGIAFRYEDDPPLGQPLSVIARLDKNEFGSRARPQLVIQKFIYN